MLTYFIKINVALAVFYLVYRLCFGRDTLFGARRWTLWIMVALAFVYPLIRITLPATSVIVPIFGETAAQGETPFVIDGITVTAGAQASFISPWMICMLVYLAGATVLLWRFLVQFFNILLLARRSDKRVIDGVTVRATRHPSAPFSFFGWIFIDPAKYSHGELREILAHERTHAREGHSVDVVFFDLLAVVLWVNPFAWLIKKAVRQNLEYLADKDVIRSGYDRRSYQYRLLQLSYNQPLSHLANHFSKSQLKNRIAMMNKKQTSRRGAVKYAFILPAVFSVLLLTNVRAAGITATDGMPNLPETILSETASPGEVTVSGKVVDDAGKPIAGVNIIIKGTNLGTASDAGGRFVLTYDPGDGSDIIFSMMGKHTATFSSTTGADNLTITMKESATPIDEISVTGYLPADDNPVQVAQTPPPPAQRTRQAQQSDVHTFNITVQPDSVRIREREKAAELAREAREANKDKEYFMIVEDMPTFDGGTLSAFRSWVMSQIRYPKKAQEEKLQGQVTLSFIIEEDGRLTNIEILQSAGSELDSEAVRIVSSSPDWEPGKQRDKPVRVKFTLPINFRLSE